MIFTRYSMAFIVGIGLLVTFFSALTASAQSPVEQLGTFLKNGQGEIADQGFASVALDKAAAKEAHKLLWTNHVQRLKETRGKEMADKVIVLGKTKMKFHYQVFGQKPGGGRSLYISMHGGGGAPAAVNDQQWENQKRLYKLDEGVYLVPRAPTNTWNLWHQGHIDDFFARLIENMVVFENVNPDRVYIMGYSAGGDGVYQLAPRMADRLAAAAMMAGHPNETSPLGLRNIGFTLHMGERDSSYNRNTVAKKWKEQLAELQKNDPQGYHHHVQIHAGKGHWMDRQDAVAIPWMSKITRNPYPNKIVWKQDDVVHDRFYWLAVDKELAGKRAEVVATLKGQTIQIEKSDVAKLKIRLNDEMVDMEKPVKVIVGGKEVFNAKVSRNIGTLARTLSEDGDPKAVYAGEIEVAVK